jgi:hypothetical protein
MVEAYFRTASSLSENPTRTGNFSSKRHSCNRNVGFSIEKAAKTEKYSDKSFLSDRLLVSGGLPKHIGLFFSGLVCAGVGTAQQIVVAELLIVVFIESHLGHNCTGDCGYLRQPAIG